LIPYGKFCLLYRGVEGGWFEVAGTTQHFYSPPISLNSIKMVKLEYNFDKKNFSSTNKLFLLLGTSIENLCEKKMIF
jgi:hypothetical protein